MCPFSFSFLLIAIPHGQHYTHEIHEQHFGIPFHHQVVTAPVVHSAAIVAQPGKCKTLIFFTYKIFTFLQIFAIILVVAGYPVAVYG